MISTDKLYGLVLAGGKSVRMGTDKGLLTYHGIPQREYLYQLLTPFCDKVFLGIRKEQEMEIPNNYLTVIDQDLVKGPFNSLLSAHHTDPEAAWLVLACDLPMIDAESIERLINNRDKNKVATAFCSGEQHLPEPLVAIWEPTALQQATAWIEREQKTCPRKYLINSDIQSIYPDNDLVLMNANSQDDYEQALKQLAANEQ